MSDDSIVFDVDTDMRNVLLGDEMFSGSTLIKWNSLTAMTNVLTYIYKQIIFMYTLVG